ncbi:MAG: PIN domain-containing protein [Verrucomicrobia bacterium]|jgi:predicted nucleic acid-binding protein|nr:PIN domain-containing protein [Verrucomicrobiota bacterium]MDA7510107.1 PIN domain-containing protein [Verrucomicrobiota bacterium]MDB4796640.1 PIN domain-containing protein [bacterium]
MSVKNLSFLDSNVVIYAYDSSGGQKQSIAQKLLTDGLRDESTVISTQVLGELFFLTVNRKKILSNDEGEEALLALSAMKTQLIDPPMIRQAIGIHRRFELRY